MKNGIIAMLFAAAVIFAQTQSYPPAGSQPQLKTAFARVASGLTAASANSIIDVGLTWNTAFADTNYTVSCSLTSLNNTPAMSASYGKSASGITMRLYTYSASASSATVECFAVHD